MDILDILQGPEDEADIAKREEKSPWCAKMYLNGDLLDTKSNILNIDSSPLSNGIFFSEYYTAKGNEPFLWREHYLSIKRSAALLGIEESHVPANDVLLRRTQVLSQKNHYPGYSLFRIVFWQNIFGDKTLNYAIVQSRLPNNPFDVNNTYVELLSFDDIPTTVAPISQIDMPNVIYSLAHQKALKNGYNGASILNNDGNIITTTLGNIYILKGYDVIGVRTTDGARHDALNTVIEEAVRSEGYNMKYTSGIPSNLISSAYGGFVLNTQHGFHSISRYNNRAYYTDQSVKIAMQLRKIFVY